MARHRLLSVFVGIAVFALGMVAVANGAATNSQSDLDAASPESVSCTIWSQEGGYGSDRPVQCTLSEPWWHAWENCDITPVHAERFEYPRPFDQHLKSIPWIIAESADVTLIGHLFYGNRPLIEGGRYDLDGAHAKVLWEFGEHVQLESVTGVNLWNPDETATLLYSVANSNTSYSSQFPMYMIFPSGGCWETTLAGIKEDGEAFSAAATFIVIDK